MEKKNITIRVFTVVVMLGAVANAAGDKKQPRQQLAEIAKYVIHQQQAIEDYYQGQLIELRLRAATEFGILEAARQKTIYSLLLEWESLKLEKQKRYALTVRLIDLEKRLKENLLKGEPETTYGLITGIVYSEQNASAIIDGKIVHKQDSIHGVKVVDIQPGNVKFEKNGRVWRQKVRETPPFWQ